VEYQIIFPRVAHGVIIVRPLSGFEYIYVVFHRLHLWLLLLNPFWVGYSLIPDPSPKEKGGIHNTFIFPRLKPWATKMPHLRRWIIDDGQLTMDNLNTQIASLRSQIQCIHEVWASAKDSSGILFCARLSLKGVQNMAQKRYKRIAW